MSICNHVNFFSEINHNKIICLDLGNKNIGVGISDQGLKFANPLKVIKRKNFKTTTFRIISTIKDENIAGIVLGWPINMDGSEGPSSQSIKDTCRIISENLDLPISLWDERLSTVGAFNLSSQLDVNISKRVKNIDQNAATFILQGAIDYLNN